MAALSVVLIGVGAYLVYEAFKSSTPTPLIKAKTAIGVKTKGG